MRYLVLVKIVGRRGHDEAKVRPLARYAMTKLQPRDRAGKLRVGDNDFDLRVLIEQRAGIIGVVSVESLES